MAKSETYVSFTSIIFWAAFTVWLWIISYTIFFPVFLSLVLFRTLRAKFFAFVHTFVLRPLFPDMTDLQNKFHDMIKESCVAKNSNKPLRFLEIGVGEGANFSLYPDDCSLTLLDMNPNFRPYITKKLKAFPNLKVEKIVLAAAEDMKGVEDDYFDVVVSSHLLCSVSDVNAVLKEVCRVLKPGGKYAFMDHVAFQENVPTHLIQKWLTPIWRVYMDGCCLDRDITSMIEKKFDHILLRPIYPQYLPLFARAHLFGVATR